MILMNVLILLIIFTKKKSSLSYQKNLVKELYHSSIIYHKLVQSIFSLEKKIQYEQQSKIEGIFTDINHICEALQHASYECDQNVTSINCIPTNNDVINQSFMYTQVLKEILLTINFEEKHIEEFISYCRDIFVNNINELKNIDKFEEDYHQYTPIWWYTYQCFLYSMINRVLRTMEIDLIIRLGFYIQDLHKHIVELHSKQYGNGQHLDPFNVYRGQGLSRIDFDQLVKTKGNLLSFNNFMSTSKNRRIALDFARRSMQTTDVIGVLFVMNIDPSISSTPFADVSYIAYYQTEEEILFSMHSIFRIGEIKRIEGYDRVFQIELTLTSDNDPQLYNLTECIRQETFPHKKGWHRLAELLIKLARFDKAQQVCEVIRAQSTDDHDKSSVYHMLGIIKDNQGEYVEAMKFHKKTMEINQKILSSTHADVANSLGSIGLIYEQTGQYSKALSYYDKVLDVFKKILPSGHQYLATTYNNIALIYDKMGDYSKSLSYYEKVLAIDQITLPSNHPHLATCYNNIGLVYHDMNDYSKALSYYEKALEIRQKSFPSNHPNLTMSFSNIGLIYGRLDDYNKALSYQEKALDIQEKTLPPNHPDLAITYNNIGSVYVEKNQFSEALSFHHKALEIFQKTLPSNHLYLATSYDNISLIHENLGHFSEALSFYERALDTGQSSLSDNHPDLQTFKNNVEIMKQNLDYYCF